MIRGFGHALFYLLALGVLLSGGAALAANPGAWQAILICVTGALATSLICERLARRYLRSTLGALRRVADDVGHGRPASAIEAHPGDDFYKLASAINLVAARLSEATRRQRELHDELRRRERLAFLGELAATVAHEVNNPLDGVQSCVRILRRSEDPVRAAQMLDLIDSGLGRIAMIVRRLLTLARENVIKPTPTPVRVVLTRAITAVQAMLGAGITLQRLDSDEPDVAAVDPQLLEQVFVNLLTNAADSMPGGGALVVAQRCEQVGNPDRAAGLVHVSIRDTGHGIPPDLLPHIFEPFVTTKRDGKGTGLGLPIAARIIDAHHGALTVETHEDAPGVTFHVRIPRIDTAAPAR
ncbi:MAG: hypothetical protein HRU75_09565 [Planctomycetia bacterium]|nr:MAG: hypothetical protein HRU75_09565 [Planctomycetia bacterium]